MGQLLSWGRYPHHPQTPHPAHWPEDVSQVLGVIAALGHGATLAFGCGRSYGDSCLAESGHVVAMQNMDRVLDADWETGVVLAQAGLTLAELIRIALHLGRCRRQRCAWQEPSRYGHFWSPCTAIGDLP